MGQQLSWLAAACRATKSGLAYSRITFTSAHSETAGEIPSFRIQVEVEPPLDIERKGCWNVLAGCSVLVTGFPIPERPERMTGLESQLGILSSLIGIRQAVTYRQGYVLKGRFHALVPVKKQGPIQWHLIDTFPRKLKWADIDKMCPERVLGTALKDLKDLQFSRAFLGWYPNVRNNLGESPY